MAVAKWISIVFLFHLTGITSGLVETHNVTTYYLETCKSPIVVKLRKDLPNHVVKVHLFDSFPKRQLKECRTDLYAYIEEFYAAWLNRNLTKPLKNYKLLITLEDLNWSSECENIYCLLEDAGMATARMCNSLEKNIFHYKFHMKYRRFLPLEKDFFLDMSVAVAYLPSSHDDKKCPSDEFFQCKSDSLCIPSSFQCDEINHCADHSDENGCKRTETPITASEEFSEETLQEELSSVSSHEDYSSEEEPETVTYLTTSSTISTTAKSTLASIQTTSKVLATTSSPPKISVTSASTSASTKIPTTRKENVLTTMSTPSTPRPTPEIKTTKLNAIQTTVSEKVPSTPEEITHVTTEKNPPTKPFEKSTLPSITPDVTTPQPETSFTQMTSVTTATSSVSTTAIPVETDSSLEDDKLIYTTSNQTLLEFPLTEKPSIQEITDPPATTQLNLLLTNPEPPQTPIESNKISNLAPTKKTSATRLTKVPLQDDGDRQKHLYDIEINSSGSNNSKDPTVRTNTNPTKKSSPTKYNDAPYPFGPRSDRLDSRSRNSPATSNNNVPNQKVLIALCLVLVFIYFFL